MTRRVAARIASLLVSRSGTLQLYGSGLKCKAKGRELRRGGSYRCRRMRYSVVVPAHNEEMLLPDGLRAIAIAAERIESDVEVIVVANRCTDATAALARDAGAIVVEDESRNISTVRNVGAAAATGDALVTIDADCVMSPMTLREIERLLATDRLVGGGTRVVPERRSTGILATYALMEGAVFLTRLGGGCFWCLRSDFEAIEASTNRSYWPKTSISPGGYARTASSPDAGSPTSAPRLSSRRAGNSTDSVTGTCSAWRCSCGRSGPR